MENNNLALSKRPRNIPTPNETVCASTPPSLNIHRARLSPLATLDEEAELLFSDAFHDHLTEYDLAQYTHSPQTKTKPHHSNRTHPPTTHRMDPGSGTNSRQSQAQKRPVGSQWEP
eukprot:scaffold6956_cov131-Isochrysis_galbana.AAC.5